MMAMNSEEKIQLEQQIIQQLKIIYDPEIPVNIYDLGLVYDIIIGDHGQVQVRMTLTSPNCPVAETLPGEVRQKIQEISGIQDVQVEIVFDPPWSKDMISQEGLLDLGFL